MLGLGVLFHQPLQRVCYGSVLYLIRRNTGYKFQRRTSDAFASLVILLLTAVVFRPLLFASLDEDVAEAKGLPTLLLGVIFMLLVAVATSISVQVVGVPAYIRINGDAGSNRPTVSETTCKRYNDIYRYCFVCDVDWPFYLVL